MSDKGTVKTCELFTNQLVAATSNPYPMQRGPTTFQATVVTTSTGASAVITSATVVQISNDGTGWLPYGTCNSTGSGTASDGFAANAPWAYARMVISTLTTGIAAQLTAHIGM